MTIAAVVSAVFLCTVFGPLAAISLKGDEDAEQ